MLIVSDEVNAECVNTWQKALDALPTENLSPSEAKQKEQYEAGLKEASKPRLMRVHSSELPWDMAEAMFPELLANQAELSGSSVGTLISNSTCRSDLPIF